MGKLGFRTARDIDRAARWTAAAPRGRRYWIVRCAATAVYLAVSTHWGDSAWLLGVALFVLAELIAPRPVDLDQPAPGTGHATEPRHGAMPTIATVGLLIVAAAALYPFGHVREGQGSLLLLVVAVTEWCGPRLATAIRKWPARGS